MTRSTLLIVLFDLIILVGVAPIASAHYDPGTGRWLERDPVRFGDGMNLYEYARSTPATLLDPRGLKACCGPKVDGWFAKELNLHSNFWNRWNAGPLWRPFYFANYAKTIPYKWMDFGSDCPDKQGEACAGTVMLCGVCIHKSELGNLMYGAIGKQWLRGERLIIGGGRRGGGTGGIDSPEDLAGVLGGIFLEGGGLATITAQGMCDLLKQDHSPEVGEIRTAFTEGLQKLFDQVNGKNLLGTMGSKYTACADCGVGDFAGGHTDFSGVGNDGADLAKNWKEREVYRNLPITWPGDPKKDPCACNEEKPDRG